MDNRPIGQEMDGSNDMPLRSFVEGAWTEPIEDGTPVHDAVTGEQITTVSTDGIDMAGVVGYGRQTGGPALHALNFHQRAAVLKALAGHLRDHRDELYAVSKRTGATLGDAKFDVDGGFGALFSYA